MEKSDLKKLRDLQQFVSRELDDMALQIRATEAIPGSATQTGRPMDDPAYKKLAEALTVFNSLYDAVATEPAAYKCEQCDHICSADDTEEDPLYECPDGCGYFTKSNSLTGDNHQCPECRKFSTYVGERACPDCNEGPMQPLYEVS